MSRWCRIGGLRRLTLVAILFGLLPVCEVAAQDGFVLGQTYAVGERPFGIAAGDFDEDGQADLAVAVHTDGQVYLLSGQGEGLFGNPRTLTLDGIPVAIVLEDLDADGHLDLVVSLANRDHISVFLGDGSGGFGERGDYNLGGGQSRLLAGDFDGDGRLDVAAPLPALGLVGVLYGQADGVLGGLRSLDGGETPEGLASADFDGDGYADLAVTNKSLDTVSVLPGQADGGFGSARAYDVGVWPTGALARDLNGDERPDLLVACEADQSVSVLFGQADGTLGEHVAYPVGLAPRDFVVDDFDGDGLADLVATDRSGLEIALIPGLPAGGFGEAAYTALSSVSYALAAGDFNADTLLDLAVTLKDAGRVAVLLRGDTREPKALVSRAADQAAATNALPILFDILFDEPVFGFDADDVVVDGTATGLSVTVTPASPDGDAYTLTITAVAGEGSLRPWIPAGAAEDEAGNVNLVSERQDGEVLYDITGPEVWLDSSEGEPTNALQIAVTVTFGEEVTGFEADDMAVFNATVSNFSGSGARYSLYLAVSAQGQCMARVPADAAQDAAGNGNAESYVFSRSFEGAMSIDLALGEEDAIVYGGHTTDALASEGAMALGDINGDGVDDLILGAWLADGPDGMRVDCGGVYIYFGGGTLAETNDIAGLTGEAPDVTIHGATEGDFFDYAVDAGALCVGDINGDGTQDLIIGAALADGPGEGRQEAGEAYIIYGSGSLPPVIDLAAGGADVTVYGAGAEDYLTGGAPVATGDLNGDGADDLVLAAAFADGPSDGRLDAGEVYVVYGGTGLAAAIDLAATTPNVTVYGAETMDYLADDALAVGDVNGDGLADIVAGAWRADGPGNARDDGGEAYVVYGALDLAGAIDLAENEADVHIHGAAPNDRLTLDSAIVLGDVNGDGTHDVILGGYEAPNAAGTAYVVFGSPSLPATLDFATGDADFVVGGGATDDWLSIGRSMSVGDFNGDGTGDLVLGAPLADNPGGERFMAGEVYVVFGGTGLRGARTMPGGADVRIQGAQTLDILALTHGAMADLNGDGADDLVLGAHRADGPCGARPSAGEAYVVYGGPDVTGSMDLNETARGTRILGATAGDGLTEFGAVILGDLNGDGADDVVLGASRADGPGEARQDAGEAYVVFGVLGLPVANAGPDEVVGRDAAVTLDGSLSRAPGNRPLTYQWNFLSMPGGSGAVLDDPTSVSPSFNVDFEGSYLLQLIVNDGVDESAPDTVLISMVTGPPVANAGPDQSYSDPGAVALDGSESYDPDGDPLSYSWRFVSMPEGSAAELDDVNAVAPAFDADLFGEYVLELVVDDGLYTSEPDTVTIRVLNSPPVADAGVDQRAREGAQVVLDGSASYDPEGAPLRYSWMFLSKPAGSAATLDNLNAVRPGFVVDALGAYEIQLIVNDGYFDSEPDTVLVIYGGNCPPVADAGPDQRISENSVATLNGSASYDPNGDPLTYAWRLVSSPEGSGAALDDPTAVGPVVTLDLPGDYVLELVVNDGELDSAPDTVLLSTYNTPPVADAGPDQSAMEPRVVALDGTESFDADGDPITYLWSLTSKPEGSAAELADVTSVRPTVTTDLRGTYVLQLVVNDGHFDSEPDTVVLTDENLPPVAEAGEDQHVDVGESATVDGSESYDPEGDPLTFLWSIVSKPGGSAAALTEPTALRQSITADLPGDYVLQLIVNDGMSDSAPDTVTVSTNNLPPVAEAGEDQSVSENASVTLDGSRSWDPDGDALAYSWSFVSKPPESSAALSDPASVQPTFETDGPGDYVLQLTVHDGSVESEPDAVCITTFNSPPVANAGTPRSADVLTEIALDGGESYDPDGDPLTYAWRLTAKPEGSTATLSSANTVASSFTLDVLGDYVVQLVVNDGHFDSCPHTITISTGPGNRPPVADAGPDQSFVGTTVVILDGRESYDPDEDPLSHTWRFTSLPEGSAAELNDPHSPYPVFVAEEAGDYVLQLIVNDGSLDSEPDTMVVTLADVGPCLSLVDDFEDLGIDAALWQTGSYTFGGISGASGTCTATHTQTDGALETRVEGPEGLDPPDPDTVKLEAYGRISSGKNWEYRLGSNASNKAQWDWSQNQSQDPETGITSSSVAWVLSYDAASGVASWVWGEQEPLVLDVDEQFGFVSVQSELRGNWAQGNSVTVSDLTLETAGLTLSGGPVVAKERNSLTEYMFADLSLTSDWVLRGVTTMASITYPPPRGNQQQFWIKAGGDPVPGGTGSQALGAAAWVETTHDFNDGRSHVLNFTWEASASGNAGDAFAIQIANDTPIESDGYAWLAEAGPWGQNLYYSAQQQDMAAASWSILIDVNAAQARLYDGPNGSGALISTIDLDPNEVWRLRFIHTGTASAEASADTALRLHSFHTESSGCCTGAPTADFQADALSGDNPLTVQFTDLSQGITTSRAWDFGDGSAPSNDLNPVHVYDIADCAGTYTVTLRVADFLCPAPGIAEKPDYISVASSGVLPAIQAFQANPPGIVQGQSTTLSWSSSDAQTLRIEPGIGDVEASGTLVVTPESSTTYTLVAAGECVSTDATAHVSVSAGPGENLIFYVDYNNNGAADAGEGLPGAVVFHKGVDVGSVTNEEGAVYVPGLAENDELYGRGVVGELAALKSGHEMVDGLLYSVWADSDDMNEDGSYRHTAATGTVPQYVELGHPIFAWNVMVAFEYELDAATLDWWVACFAEASKLLYDVTDGQMRFGKVHIDSGVERGSALWQNADVVIHDGEMRPNSALLAAFETQGHVVLGRTWQGVEVTTGYYAAIFPATLAHQFSHYALGLRDEFADGRGVEGDWIRYRLDHPLAIPLPWAYGLMDGYLVSELSSANDYLADYPGGSETDPSTITRQLWRSGLMDVGTGNSCWKQLELNFTPALSSLSASLRLTPPPQGVFLDGQSTSQDRIEPSAESLFPPYFPDTALTASTSNLKTARIKAAGELEALVFIDIEGAPGNMELLAQVTFANEPAAPISYSVRTDEGATHTGELVYEAPLRYAADIVLAADRSGTFTVTTGSGASLTGDFEVERYASEDGHVCGEPRVMPLVPLPENTAWLIYASRGASSTKANFGGAVSPPQSIALNGDAATLSGGVSVSFPYNDSQIIGLDETSLKLHAWSAETKRWSPVATQAVHVGRNQVFAHIYEDGAFALFGEVSDDITAPAAVTDLTADAEDGGTRVRLSWTATGDDGLSGTATSYDVRMAEQRITPSNWEYAIPYGDIVPPQPAGQREEIVWPMAAVDKRYYYALVVLDEAGNTSPISNVALALPATEGEREGEVDGEAVAEAETEGEGEGSCSMTIAEAAAALMDAAFVVEDGLTLEEAQGVSACGPSQDVFNYLDVDGDSRVSREELVLVILDTEFEELDENGDGALDFVEASEAIDGLAQAEFEELSGGDGSLTRQELAGLLGQAEGEAAEGEPSMGGPSVGDGEHMEAEDGPSAEGEGEGENKGEGEGEVSRGCACASPQGSAKNLKRFLGDLLLLGLGLMVLSGSAHSTARQN